MPSDTESLKKKKKKCPVSNAVTDVSVQKPNNMDVIIEIINSS